MIIYEYYFRADVLAVLTYAVFLLTLLGFHLNVNIFVHMFLF
jgi:hypothetical protein